MTHEELVTKIKTPNEFLGVKYAPDWQHVALLAIVELHKPIDVDIDTCYGCNGSEWWPCPTIQAIEKELQ